MKAKEAIYAGIAVVAILGFRGWMSTMKRESSGSQSAATSTLTENQRPVELTIAISAPRSDKAFQSIRRGMNFAEVSRLLGIKRYSEPVEDYFKHEYVLVKFQEEDGSRIEVEFRDGKEFRKRRLDAIDGRAADARRAREE